MNILNILIEPPQAFNTHPYQSWMETGSPAGMPCQCLVQVFFSSNPQWLSIVIAPVILWDRSMFLWFPMNSRIDIHGTPFFMCQVTRGSGRLYFSIQHQTNGKRSCGTVAPCRNQSTSPWSRPFARHASKQETNNSKTHLKVCGWNDGPTRKLNSGLTVASWIQWHF
jgi:hypothetical protein